MFSLNKIGSFFALCAFTACVLADGSLNEFLSKTLDKQKPPEASAVVIFPARLVITMEKKQKTARAVAVSGKRILGVGTVEEMKKLAGEGHYRIDDTMKDKIIMPGFIDQHLHPILGALTLTTEVIATEDWGLPTHSCKAANSPEEYKKRLTAAEKNLKDPSELLLSWGYHPLWHGKLSRAVLDGISATRPVIIWHRSAHEVIMNTAALKLLNITRADVDSQGSATSMTNLEEGHFWEQGLLNTPVGEKLFKQIATPERMERGLKQMILYEHAKGVTAYNEPGAIVSPSLWQLYEKILGADNVPMYSTFMPDGRGIVDRVGLDHALDAVETTVAMASEAAGKKVMYFPGQIKLFADGAIISQLMQMKVPYTDGHHGEWMINPDELERRAKLFWDAGYQLNIHVNGDQGVDVVAAILDRRMKENPRRDHRFTLVHFANSTPQQIARLSENGAIFSVNPYYPVGFADKYVTGLGQKRADQMVRAATILKHTSHLSFHSDLPMAPSDPLYLAWAGVNRITPDGRVAAPEQRISVDAALRAVTIEAAHSWRKEDLIGSIKPGKIANFTVLEQDPYKVAPVKLKDVPVWGTVFEGRVFPVPEEQRHNAVANMPTSPDPQMTPPVTYPSMTARHQHNDPKNCQLSAIAQLVGESYAMNRRAGGGN